MRLCQTVCRLTIVLAIAFAAGAVPAVAQVRPVPPAGTLPVNKPVAAPNAALAALINIYGTVKDLDGRTVTGVLIEFWNADNNQKLNSALTDSVGTYSSMVGVAGNQKGYKVVPSARTYAFVPANTLVTSTKRVDFTLQRTSNTK